MVYIQPYSQSSFRQQLTTHLVCALRPPLHYHISTTQNPCVRVCMVRMLLCVDACVCAYVCVASQSPLFHKVYFYLFFFNQILLLHQLPDVE